MSKYVLSLNNASTLVTERSWFETIILVISVATLLGLLIGPTTDIYDDSDNAEQMKANLNIENKHETALAEADIDLQIIPKHFLDCYTLSIMEDPVTLITKPVSAGHSVDRITAKLFIDTKQRCPFTRREIIDVVPNLTLKNIIEDWVKKTILTAPLNESKTAVQKKLLAAQSFLNKMKPKQPEKNQQQVNRRQRSFSQ